MSNKARYEVTYAVLPPAKGIVVPDEEWRLIHPNGAAVSSLGRFRNSLGHVYTPSPRQCPYTRVNVAGQSKSLHRLVAESFGLTGRTTERCQVNHRNRDPRDNRIRNLEWTTPSENVLHSHRTNALRADGRALRSKPVWVRKAAPLAGGTSHWALFRSAQEAADELRLNVSSVRRCASGAQKYAYPVRRHGDVANTASLN